MSTPFHVAYPDFLSLDSVQSLRHGSERMAAALRDVIARAGAVPLPGRGATLARWRILGAVAGADLALAKLVEPHWDAIAILEDCFPGGYAAAAVAADADEDAVWAVWAAEPPEARLLGIRKTSLSGAREGVRTTEVQLTGRKAWCSGAHVITHALVTYWNDDGQACLAAVRTNVPGIVVTDEGWHAVGMQGSASVEVLFENTSGIEVGVPGAYLERPGFWHGGMGIAACWMGASVALARAVHAALRRRNDPHALAHLGAIDAALSAAQAFVRETAAWVDDHPHEDAWRAAMRLRLAVEACADAVIVHAGRALGASPLCRDAHIARLFADLPIFLRQSHAERDLAALGKTLTALPPDPVKAGETLWTL